MTMYPALARRIKKIIICAGMPRSGSTWMYNVIRLLNQFSGYKVNGFYDTINYSERVDVGVLKIHDFKKEIADKTKLIFTSRRDLRDVIASRIRMGDRIEGEPWLRETEDEIKSFLDQNVSSYELWREIAIFDVPYEVIVNDKLSVANEIAKILGLHLNVEEVVKKVESLAKIKRKTLDQVTLLHPRHVTNGKPQSYRETLHDNSIQFIEEYKKDWLKKYGYMPN